MSLTSSGSGSVGRPSGDTIRSIHAASRRYSAMASDSTASSWWGGRMADGRGWAVGE